MTRKQQRRAFTLIEILLAIGILVVLIGAVGIVSYRKIKASTDIKTTQILVDGAAKGVDMFYTEMGRYPTTEEGLAILRTKPDDEEEAKKWRVFLEKKPVDAWGQELKYEFVGVSEDDPAAAPYKISSTGPDKEEGTDDDIKSWKDEEK